MNTYVARAASSTRQARAPNFQRLAMALLSVAVLAAPQEALGGGRQRIAIAAVRGDPRGALARELAKGLCGQLECVPASRIRKGARIDFRAAETQRTAVLVGTVSRRRAPRLELALLTTSLRPRRSWAIPLDREGRLSAGAIAALGDELRRELASGARAAPAPAKGAAVRPSPPRAPEPIAPAVAPAPLPGAPGERAAPEAAEPFPQRTAAGAPLSSQRVAPIVAAPLRPSPRGAPQAAQASAHPSRLGALDVGVELTRRKLTYSGGASSGLQEYSADAIVSPAVRLEVSPLARETDRWPGRIALFGSFSRSVGLESERAGASGAHHPTSLTRLDVGAGWRFRPVASARATVLARASYRRLALEVKPVGGAGIEGLPDADLSGPSVGLDLEAPFGARWAVLLGAGYTRWTTAEDLVGDPAFFPRGSAWAIDANAGLSVGMRGPFSLRFLADYGRTRYGLRGSSAYTVTGATDAYLGGRAVMRVTY